jgi:hypothetical protein
MPNSLPLSLLVAWVIFLGFLNTHQRHSMHFRGASHFYHLCLNISLIIGSLAGIGLLGYYFMQVAWYWPIVLVLISSLIGGFLFGFFDSKIGLLGMSMISFVGWPASALWAFFLICEITP